MNLAKLPLEECKKKWSEWIAGRDPQPDLRALSNTERNIRNKTEEFFRSNADLWVGKVKESELDSSFALELYYEILPLNGSASVFNLRLASNIDIWRRLSMIVIPDFIAIRRKVDREASLLKREDGKSYFYDDRLKNHIRGLWWYCHFAHQGDREQTSSLFSSYNNHTDPIQGLVQRPGPGGYRVELNRELLKRLGASAKKRYDVPTFKKLLVLNTAKLMLVEPELCLGGVSGYVDTLVEKINNSSK